jgi:dolichol-phosphate mannosyltransferase
MARIWVTIPTFCEAGNIARTLRAVCRELDATCPGEHRVLVVDDASPDGTADIARRLTEELPAIEVLERHGKEGLGRAYVAGFEHALNGGAELVVVMDADYSHDPRYLPVLIEASAEADLVLGSRYVEGGAIVDWPPVRRLLSRAGSLYARALLHIDVRDLTGGFRCIHRRVLERVDLGGLRSQGYVFNIELTYRALREGFTVREVPIRFADRKIGASKISLWIAIEALWLVPALRHPRLHRRTRSRVHEVGRPSRSVGPSPVSAEETGQSPEPRLDQHFDRHVPHEVGETG